MHTVQPKLARCLKARRLQQDAAIGHARAGRIINAGLEVESLPGKPKWSARVFGRGELYSAHIAGQDGKAYPAGLIRIRIDLQPFTIITAPDCFYTCSVSN